MCFLVTPLFFIVGPNGLTGRDGEKGQKGDDGTEGTEGFPGFPGKKGQAGKFKTKYTQLILRNQTILLRAVSTHQHPHEHS